jgi:hypothetical protein
LILQRSLSKNFPIFQLDVFGTTLSSFSLIYLSASVWYLFLEGII